MGTLPSQQIKNFLKKTNFSFEIGTEIEFYLDKFTEDKFAKLRSELTQFEFEREKGANQFEIKVLHTRDIGKIINEINCARKEIKRAAKKCDMRASFLPKPFSDQPGSSIHINISLHDQNKNIFAKTNGEESIYLLHAIGGLCSTMRQNMVYFVPGKSGYSRFVQGGNAPTTISWGGNNRTVAIRVPTTCSINRRIEHRVSSANSDPKKVIIAILEGIIFGIENKITPPQKIYGDASDPQYELEKL